MVNLRKYQALLSVTIIFGFITYSNDCRSQTSFKERMHFNVGIGYGNYDMKRAEIQLLSPGNFVYFEYPFKRIEGGKELYTEMTYEFLRNLSLGPGIMHSRGERRMDEWYRGLFNDYGIVKPDPILYRATVVAPYLKLSYRFGVSVINVSFNGNLYYGFATLDANIGIYVAPYLYRNYTYKSRGFGRSVSLGFSIETGGGIALENEIGYRILETGKLKDMYGAELENSNLNFNGYFIRGGISFNPGGK